ncbi:MAG: carboxypeptidase-like regulatory domain-containing protein [Myxococcota bacterium]
MRWWIITAVLVASSAAPRVAGASPAAVPDPELIRSGAVGVGIAHPDMVARGRVGRGMLGRGMLEGVVTSAPYGLAVPNASVTLRSTANAWAEVRVTDGEGAFRFDDLPAGLYSLEAKSGAAPGLLEAQVSPIIVVPGVPVSENLVLVDLAVQPPPPPAPRES